MYIKKGGMGGGESEFNRRRLTTLQKKYTVIPVAKIDTVVNTCHDYTFRITQTEFLELRLTLFTVLKNSDKTSEIYWFFLFDGSIP
jgi:hypothetical protein